MKQAIKYSIYLNADSRLKHKPYRADFDLSGRVVQNMDVFMKYKNNPFNIRYTDQQWQGLAGHKNGFCEFVSLDYGIRAWLILMRTYRRVYRIESIDNIVARFAPPSENNVISYTKFIFASTCINPHVRLQTDCDYYKLGYAMAKFESRTIIVPSDIESVAEKFNISIVS